MKYENMTIGEFLDKLTDNNYHTERMVVEAILTEDDGLMTIANVIWQAHQAYGHMPYELGLLRKELWTKIEERLS